MPLPNTIARMPSISPWQALLSEVQRGAGRCAWFDLAMTERLRTIELDPQLGDPVGDHQFEWLLTQSRNERRLLRAASEAAIRSGIAERMVAQVELEGQMIARVITRTLDRLELTDAMRDTALRIVQEELLIADDQKAISP